MEDVTVLDGGLATQLERQGEDLTSSLWSAAVLRSHPEAIVAAHVAFLSVGAHVATTATYQLTPMSLSRSGLAAAQFEDLTALAVSAAREACTVAGRGFVVGSVGPYGASLADGSEYTGRYGLSTDREQVVAALREHHRPRLAALLDNGVDALACETIPSALEVEALVRELTALGSTTPTWISLTPARGGRTTRTGEPLAAIAHLLGAPPATTFSPRESFDSDAPLTKRHSRVETHPLTAPGIFAVGVNCCRPQDVAPALRELQPAAHGLAGVAYPNSGEQWDASRRRWFGQSAWPDQFVAQWRAEGATLIGGCCRVYPEHIAAIGGEPSLGEFA